MFSQFPLHQPTVSTGLLPRTDVSKPVDVPSASSPSHPPAAASGLVPSHIEKLQAFAHSKNLVIGVRPVDVMVTDLIEAGYPTKGFHVKGKSANWGPQMGFICVDQRFSKLVTQPDRIEKFNASVTACIDAGHAQPVPLAITRQRLEKLVEHAVLDHVEYGSLGLPVAVQARSPDGVTHRFELQAVDSAWSEFTVRVGSEPLMVLAPPGPSSKPLTADYDLLIVAPHISDLGAEDNLPIPDIGHRVFKDRIQGYQSHYGQVSSEILGTSFGGIPETLQRDLNDPAAFYAREDPDIGNASPRVRSLIGAINRALVGLAEPVVHHNTDQASPATDFEANFPATFVLPVAMGPFDEVAVIEDLQDLRTLIQVAKDHGYVVRSNPLWPEDVTRIRSSSFEVARQALAGSI